MSVEDFELKLKQYNPDLEYYSGYKTSEDKVQLRCKKCGTIFERYASCVRKKKKIRCYQCEKNETARKKDLEKQKKQLEKEATNYSNLFIGNMMFSICEECGEIVYGNRRYCSQKCNQKALDRKKDYKRRSRMKNNGNYDYTISLTKLIKRDNNICYLCGKECNLNDYTYNGNTFIAGNYYPSIEHIVPLSKGGTHTWNNIKLAHRICNTLKKDNLII